jgi:hypothetical protein
VVVVQRGVVHRWLMSPAPQPKELRPVVAASHVLQKN